MSAIRLAAAWWVLGLGLLAGCGKDATGPKAPSMTGTWNGSSTPQFITLSLTESNTHVQGSGTITNGVTTALLTITGSHNHPQVSLTVTPGGFTPIVVTGTFQGADSITAQLNGSGFSNFGMVFVRQ
jgi:hypothetical protein